MIFQILDNKRECYAIYCDGDLYHYPNNLNLTETWDWSYHVPTGVDCAQVWAGGKSLKEVCPEELLPRLASVQTKGKAFLNAFHNSKINLNDVCFYDLVPKSFLFDYCAIKNDVSKHVFNSISKPKNYDFLIKLCNMLDSISQRELLIADKPQITLNPVEMKRFLELKKNTKIRYNLWGSRTGRLTTTRDSFPILTLPKNFRHLLRPNKDLYVELDYNSAEMRTALALSGKQQPDMDIHNFLRQEIYKERYTREETKQKVFAWLYNPKARNKNLSEYISKEKILNKYYASGIINTPFNRDIPVDEAKALNYLVQSTTSDMFLTQAIKIHDILKETDSEIAFCIHDSLIIDMSKSDQSLLHEIISTFKNTDLGKFNVNVSMGKSFGAMRKIL